MCLLFQQVWEKLRLRRHDYAGQFYKKTNVQWQLCNQRIKCRTKDNRTEGEARRQGGRTLRLLYICVYVCRWVYSVLPNASLHFSNNDYSKFAYVCWWNCYILQIQHIRLCWDIKKNLVTYFHRCPQSTHLYQDGDRQKLIERKLVNENWKIFKLLKQNSHIKHILNGTSCAFISYKGIQSDPLWAPEIQGNSEMCGSWWQSLDRFHNKTEAYFLDRNRGKWEKKEENKLLKL